MEDEIRPESKEAVEELHRFGMRVAMITGDSTRKVVSKQMKDCSVFLRLSLGISFLAAVADRFGLWGSFGQPNVAWGDFSHFVAYTRKLNWFMPSAAIPALAWAATCAEIPLVR